MTFCEKLNNYIEQLECSSQELANASGLSSAVISRYRNGERTPNIKSKQLESLSNGLHKISIDKKVNISKEEIYNALANTLSDIVIDFEQLSKNFSELVSTLNISIANLARSIGYDSSFVSRIRTGSRNPSKPKEFIISVTNGLLISFPSSPTGSVIFSHTLSDGIRLKFWNINPIFLLLNIASFSSFRENISLSFMYTFPSVGLSSPPII